MILLPPIAPRRKGGSPRFQLDHHAQIEGRLNKFLVEMRGDPLAPISPPVELRYSGHYLSSSISEVWHRRFLSPLHPKLPEAYGLNLGRTSMPSLLPLFPPLLSSLLVGSSGELGLDPLQLGQCLGVFTTACQSFFHQHVPDLGVWAVCCEV